MLKIVRSIQELDFNQLKAVYAQSCQENGALNYPHYPIFQQQLFAEQDFLGDLQCFFQDVNAFCALWVIDGNYASALRMEPYGDGYLVEGLETAPCYRKKGFAKLLLTAVLKELRIYGSVSVYSHIEKINAASLAVHIACGFEKIRDCAVYADGSVSQNACTMRIVV